MLGDERLKKSADDRSFRALVAQLSTKQKTSRGASAYARFVNRPLGRYLAAGAFRLGMTPNQVSAVSAAFSLAGILLIAFGAPGLPVALGIAACLVVGYALDSADGQLARLQGSGSFAGEWLDHVIDAAKMSALHLAVLVAWYRQLPSGSIWLAIPVFYEFLAVVLFFAIVLTDQMRRAHRGSTQMRLAGEGSSTIVYSLAVLPTEYGVLAMAFVFWGAVNVFHWIYLGFFVVNAVFVVLALPKWFKELRSYGAVG